MIFTILFVLLFTIVITGTSAYVYNNYNNTIVYVTEDTSPVVIDNVGEPTVVIDTSAVVTTDNPGMQEGNVEASAGKVEITGNVGNVEVEMEKKVGKIDNTVDPNKLTLLHQTSINECVYNKNYGLINDNKMFISDGCRGYFTYKGQYGPCGSIDGKYMECPIGSYDFDTTQDLKGLVKTKLKLIKDKSNGKCVNGKWGKEGSNVYVKDGCKGLFQYGTLFGYCSSHLDDTGNYEKQLCKIGKTSEDTKFEEGDAIRMRYTGLRKQNPKYKEQDQKNCFPPYSSDVRFAVTSDNKNIMTEGSCKGTFSWGPYKGYCIPEEKCPVGTTSNYNGTTIGLMVEDKY